MATKDFVQFYNEYLPKNPAIKKELDEAADQIVFRDAAVAHGKKAGFDFTGEDVNQVMKASNHAARGGELSENALEGVVGGAGTLTTTPTVQITSVKSSNLKIDPSKFGNTVMCTGW